MRTVKTAIHQFTEQIAGHRYVIEVSAVASYIRRSWANQASVVRPDDVSKYRHTPID